MKGQHGGRTQIETSIASQVAAGLREDAGLPPAWGNIQTTNVCLWVSSVVALTHHRYLLLFRYQG